MLRHGRRAEYADFRPDGRWLATAGRATSGHHEVTLWDLETARKVVSLRHDAPVSRVVFAPDGRRLLSQAFDGVARVWAIDPPADAPGIVRATFSPDGTWLATAERPGTVLVHDMTGGQARRPEIRLRPGQTYDLAWAPDSRRLVIVGESARVWDTHTGAPLTPPLEHQPGSSITHGAFSADGHSLVTTTTDGSARVWESATGLPITPRLAHPGVRRATFSPDGSRVITAGGGGARLWDLSGSSSPESDEQLGSLARALASRRIDAIGALVPLDSLEFQEMWDGLSARNRGPVSP
jgi:WD40 repeat protein